MLIFPEGGNFSPTLRLRAIQRLEEAGHHEETAWARQMEHVAAPRPGGALAALEATPQATWSSSAISGSRLDSPTCGGSCPARQTVKLHMWLVRAGEIPAGHDERIDWLFGWWRTLDNWVAGS